MIGMLIKIKEWFMSLFKTEECAACKVYEQQIAFMKGLIEAIQRERDAERIEYKRAMDVILVREKLPIVGQAPSSGNTMTPDIQKLMGFFEEESKEK
jgi:hypothetical protein